MKRKSCSDFAGMLNKNTPVLFYEGSNSVFLQHVLNPNSLKFDTFAVGFKFQTMTLYLTQ